MEKSGTGSSRFSKITAWLKKEAVMLLALAAAAGTSFFSAPKLSYIDFRVLSLLFCLMCVVAAFRLLNVLDAFAVAFLKKTGTERGVTAALVYITFFFSMLVTNDVALLTFIPLALIVCRTAGIRPVKVLVLQTLAANLGSAVTPMGNPQNLFLFSFYRLSAAEFFAVTLPLGILSFFLLLIPVLTVKKNHLRFDLRSVYIEDKKKTALFTVLLAVILLSVFHVLDYRLSLAVTLIVVAVFNRRAFRVDYSLLITFTGFFIFIGNLAANEHLSAFMKTLLGTARGVYFASVGASQLISNVPAAMLLSGFTSHARALILGVNVGGLGTLIASLASVITYKIYQHELSRPFPADAEIKTQDSYLKTFTVYNLVFLAVLTPVFFLLV